MRPADDVRQALYTIVNEADTPLGQAFDFVLLVLILASVISTMLETVRSIHAQHAAVFWFAERVFTGIFAAEYALRTAVAKPDARAYVCSFFGAVDLVAILPTLLEEVTFIGASSMRIVRVLRLLRVFRVLHHAGLNAEVESLLSAFWSARRKILVFVLGILMLTAFMGTAMYIIEDNNRSGFTSIPRSIYWAIVTVTTVGYGDIAPQTVTGQALASMMMVAGYSLLAVPTGIAAAEYSLQSSGSGSSTNRKRGGARGGGPSMGTTHGAKKIVPTSAYDECEAEPLAHDLLGSLKVGEVLTSEAYAQIQRLLQERR